jgi:hypothetical protein
MRMYLCTISQRSSTEMIIGAVIVVLYRPYVLNGPTVLPFEVQALWQKKALNQARAAASNTNSLLEKLIDLDAVQFLRLMMCETT